MKTISVNPERLFTKLEYSKQYNISRPTIDKKIKEKLLKTLKVKGTVLIMAQFFFAN